MSDGEAMVQAFHDRHAGRTFESFGRGSVGHCNSYELLAHAAGELATGACVLDLACGDGVLLDLVSKLRAVLELIGVDLNAAELDVARRRQISNATFTRARASALPISDQQVDLVLCHMSFMLFDRPGAVARELARVTRPGGRVVLLVSDGSSPEGARRRFVELVGSHKVPLPMLGTRDARNMESLENLFTAEGFERRRLEEVELNLDGSPEVVWQGLSLMYNFEPLSETQRRTVEAGFFKDFGGLSKVRYRISLIHAVFEKVEGSSITRSSGGARHDIDGVVEQL